MLFSSDVVYSSLVKWTIYCFTYYNLFYNYIKSFMLLNILLVYDVPVKNEYFKLVVFECKLNKLN